MTSEQNYAVYNNSLDTLERAVKERVFFVKDDNGDFAEPRRPSQEEFNAVTEAFEKVFKTHTHYTTPMEASKFAESYRDRRRAVYIKAAQDNVTHGFDPKTAHVKAFVKCEKYNFTKKVNPVPRIIQPRDPRYLVESGRYIKPIEKKIYNIIDRMFEGITVFKGLNALSRGTAIKQAWDHFKRPVAIGLDASRFDQHVSNAALKKEHSFYERFYPGDKHFQHLMKLQRNNICKGFTADGSVKYTTKHNRMSGDSNTSLGNVIIMCSIIYGLFDKLELNARLVNDGDDCVIICEQDRLNGLLVSLRSWFQQAGFKITIEEPVYVLEHIEFCQSHPVRGPDGAYVMVRNPRTSLSKDCVAIKPLDNAAVKEMWLSAVGLGGLSLNSGIPVQQEFYTCLKRASNGAKCLSDPTLESGFMRLSRGMKARYLEITPETRLSYWLAFGITPTEQLSLEQYYTQLSIKTGDVLDRYEILPL